MDTSVIVWQNNIRVSIYDITFSPDSRQIAVATDSGITIFDISNGAQIKEIFSTSTFWTCRFSSDGKYLAGASRSGFFKVWRTEDYSLAFEYDVKQEFMLSLDFSKDSKYLAVAGEKEGILIFDINNWTLFKQRKSFPFYNDPKYGGHPTAYKVNFSNDGSKLLFSGDWSFIYDIANDTILKTFEGKLPQYSPDNKLIGCKYWIDGNQGLYIYDTASTTPIKKYTFGDNNF